MIARLLFTLLLLLVGLGALFLMIYLVKYHPAFGIPIALLLFAWGLIHSYNLMLKQIERHYRRKK
ncbi:MAG: hypothetical protein D6819_06605 [Gammaproteobacteria bacterium]|nr:MAG: hypothetical protein D6819_06605 [Gammaproteobacteria bacterium]